MSTIPHNMEQLKMYNKFKSIPLYSYYFNICFLFISTFFYFFYHFSTIYPFKFCIFLHLSQLFLFFQFYHSIILYPKLYFILRQAILFLSSVYFLLSLLSLLYIPLSCDTVVSCDVKIENSYVL